MRAIPSPRGGAAEASSGWDALAHLIEESAIETGITDLAHQHDHYLYGTPKRDE